MAGLMPVQTSLAVWLKVCHAPVMVLDTPCHSVLACSLAQDQTFSLLPEWPPRRTGRVAKTRPDAFDCGRYALPEGLRVFLGPSRDHLESGLNIIPNPCGSSRQAIPGTFDGGDYHIPDLAGLLLGLSPDRGNGALDFAPYSTGRLAQSVPSARDTVTDRLPPGHQVLSDPIVDGLDG